LQSLQSGIALDTDSLQSLSYVYDEVGNVQSITDTNAGGTQTQTFTYDDLDRLSSAVASGGTGGTYALKDYDYDTQGRLEINGTVTNYYENTAHIHAVSKTSTGNTYSYDQNGNQTSRKVSGITYTLIYDAESRLVQIKRGNNIQAKYFYDGDGNRVKAVVGSTTTTYIGNYLEWTGSTTTMKKYYYAGGQRVALRQGSSTLYFLLTDHLGSTAVTATSGGGLYGELRYYPWGGTRYDTGTTPTSYRYTGQREAEVGLYYYGARYYDPLLGRFVSPDTIIPQQQGSQAWDRYAGMNNNPIRYTDPTGHCVICTLGQLIIQTISSVYESQNEATHQALGLVVDWFFETGPENQSFGPDNALTQEVMHDQGIDQFREEWAQNGYQLPFTWQHTADERESGSLPERLINGASVFVREHVVELGLSILGFSSDTPEGSIDPVGGTIGSLDQITVSDAGNGQLLFKVDNTMGWQSGLRIYGTNESLVRNRDRNAWGPGGTTYQTFYWYESSLHFHGR